MKISNIENVTMISSDEAFLDASIQLIEKASRYLRIRSSLLDPDLFDQKSFNDALSAFARKSRYSEVQILVDYPDRILERGHNTIMLMRRLSHKIIIKEYYDDPDEHRDSYIISDNRGILIKKTDPGAEGYFSLTDGVYTKNLVETFAHEWEMSPVARQLRNMIL